MKQSEKEQLYHQMTMVLAEVQRLLKIYEELKDHVFEESNVEAPIKSVGQAMISRLSR